MKPTSDDEDPRRDGWFEHEGTWQEVTIGTVIANRQRRSERWEIMDVAMGTHAQYGRTLWMRAREHSTGAEFTVEPRLKTARVTILTRDPADTDTGPIAEPSDGEAIMAVVNTLGAEFLASRDSATGEITCPDYIYDSHIEGDYGIQRGLIEHMKFAHAHRVAPDTHLADLMTIHGRAHNPKYPEIGKGGFPHRHIPEDLTIT